VGDPGFDLATRVAVTPVTAPAAVTSSPQPTAEKLEVASTAHVETLAAVLFDWRVECEEHLRVLTCIQRYLERIRSPAVGAGERGLLLQEISRLLASSVSAPEDWRQRAAALAVSFPCPE